MIPEANNRDDFIQEDPPQKTPKKTKGRFFRQIQNIESLISAPLIAVSKANAMMLTGQARFLLENCFEKSNGKYMPILIEMTMKRGEVQSSNDGGGIDIATQCIHFQVPLISLLPLNNLAIDKLKLDFGLNITSSFSGKGRKERKEEGKIPGVMKKTSILNGRIAEDDTKNGGKNKGGRQTSSQIKVSIEVKSQDLPKGTKTLLDLYSKMITPVSVSGEDKADETT